MKKLIVLPVLIISMAAAANIKELRGKNAVERNTQQLRNQLQDAAELNREMRHLNNKAELNRFKAEYSNVISKIVAKANRLEQSVANLKFAPPLKVSHCQVMDQDHGGLTDRGGSVIYKRKRDYRICARVSIANPRVKIRRVEFLIDGQSITTLTPGITPTNVFEGKGKGFYYNLPSMSESSYSKCFPEFGNELRVTTVNNAGERKVQTVPIHPELINFDGRSKYQVNQCDY